MVKWDIMVYWKCSQCGNSIAVHDPYLAKELGLENKLFCTICLNQATRELLKKEKEKNSKMLEYFKEVPKMKVKKMEPRYKLIISQSEGEVIEKALKHGLTTINILSDYEKDIAQSVRADLQLGMDWRKGEDE